jgi:hypothetical protein
MNSGDNQRLDHVSISFKYLGGYGPSNTGRVSIALILRLRYSIMTGLKEREFTIHNEVPVVDRNDGGHAQCGSYPVPGRWIRRLSYRTMAKVAGSLQRAALYCCPSA